MPDSGPGLTPATGGGSPQPARVGFDGPADRPPLSDGLLQDGLRQQFRWAWRVLWRGKHLVIACLILALTPTILVLEQTRPLYTAEVRLVVESPDVRDALSERAFRPWLSEQVIQTEANLISSTVVAHRVADKLRLAEDPEFNGTARQPATLATYLRYLNPLTWIPRGDDDTTGAGLDPAAKSDMERAALVRRLLGGLQVEPQRRSYVISVRYTTHDREKARLIANTVAETYVLDRLEAGFEEARQVSSWLGERLDTLRNDVVAAEGAVEDYRAQHGLRRKGGQQTTVTDQQMSELNSRLVMARADLGQKQARLDQVRNLLRSRGSMDSTSDVLQSQLIQRLREQEAGLQREMSDAQKTYGERHPRLVGLRAELGEIRGKIAGEIEKIAASYANEVEVAMAGVRTLERELEAVRQQANVAGEAEIRLRELERQAEATRTLYEAFLNRFKREAEQERMQRANARIVSPAEVPMAPSYPRKPPVIIMAALIALAAGVALVFLLDHLDNVIRSSDEAEELSGLPVLGVIPLRRNRRVRGFEEILSKPRSALADAVRSLRTSIDLGSSGPARVVMVTSSVPKEGKTFVSLSLALMYAQSGGRVLLIDADIHRPRLHSEIGAEGDRGLAQILGGDGAFEDLVQRGAVGTLDFLPAGRAANVAELVRAPVLDRLIKDLLEQYDRIVIDTAPVLAVSDTRVIGRLVDRVVYLVRWNATPRDATRNGLKILRGSGVNVFGIVLSQVNQRKHARYGYRDYGHYYGRYRDYYAE
ncbi:GumC family protein [Azospirillum halopraeferens]|uniref:GumC family protein n=1 Tax=Azospirillum halopraeferens TaxID=34010 RepID=UPI00041C2214|nr:polysaccharide biosynthesis tyrosine autokinase [Azospirillum halopraeferens]